MRSLIFILCLLVLPLSAAAQAATTSKLTGTVFDVEGSVVVGATVTATDSKQKKYEAVTDQDGVYVLTLPFNKYDREHTWDGEAKYNLTVEWRGFKKSETKGYVFVPSYSGTMHLDIALELGRPVDSEHP